jgi:hypothetical protein
MCFEREKKHLWQKAEANACEKKIRENKMSSPA